MSGTWPSADWDGREPSPLTRLRWWPSVWPCWPFPSIFPTCSGPTSSRAHPFQMVCPSTGNERIPRSPIQRYGPSIFGYWKSSSKYAHTHTLFNPIQFAIFLGEAIWLLPSFLRSLMNAKFCAEISREQVDFGHVWMTAAGENCPFVGLCRKTNGEHLTELCS